MKHPPDLESEEAPVSRRASFWQEPDPDRAGGRRAVAGSPLLNKLVRERPLFIEEGSQRLVHTVLFAGIVALLLIFFRPSLLLSTTTATGGDTGAHIYAPWYLKNHLLPQGLLAGWSPGWFAGFPLLTFYFPLVATIQVLLDSLIPYEVAFKIGTILGTFFLPVSVYLLLRLLRFSFPAPIVGGILSIGFLFMDSFSIYGGNIASSLSGEYSYSLSIGLCFVFYGLAYRLAVEDRGRPLLAAATLALAVLSHLVPVIMVVLTLPLLMYWAVRTHGPRRAGLRMGVVLGVAFLLTAFWSVPFLARIQYTSDMRWTPVGGWRPLLPRELWVYLILAAAGCITAMLRRDRRILVLVVPALMAMALYFIVPQGRAWNGRFIPFWYLGVFLCAAYFIGTSIPSLARALWKRRSGEMAIAMTAVLLIAVGGWVLREKERSFVDYWIEYNYEGYESKSDYSIFKALMDRMESLPPGRIMWEPSSDLGRFGTPIALMSFPYWTGQPSMEGIYFESSITTPFHFLMASEVAQRPSNPIPGLPYHSLDLKRGLQHMQLFDVSYYIVVSDEARKAAHKTEGLDFIANVEDLSIFGVDSTQVTVPQNQPIVLEDKDWIDANIDWFADPSQMDVPLVQDGPGEWARAPSAASAPRRALEHGGKSFEARMTDDEITFTTDAVGEPHWVKTSYFPNWRAEGAVGPFLASPSLMMVIPTQPQVRLSYERTWAEWSGLLLTIGALAGLLAPWSRRRIARLEGS